MKCHDIDTAIDDFIELNAMHRVFKLNDHADELFSLFVDFVKTNLNHNETVNELISIIKITLAFEKSSISVTIDLKKLNFKIKSKK